MGNEVKYLYVDGYNIINNWNSLKEIKDKISLLSARDELILNMEEYSKLSGLKVRVIFDAYNISKKEYKDKFFTVKVIYTKIGQTADAYIERALDVKRRGSKILVATSDAMIQQTVLSRGGLRMSAAELLREYEELKKSAIKKEIRKYEKELGKGIGYPNHDMIKKLEEYENKLKK